MQSTTTDFIAALQKMLQRDLLPYCKDFALRRDEGCCHITLYPKADIGRVLIVDNLPRITGLIERVIPLSTICINGDAPINADGIRKLYPVSSSVSGIEEKEQSRLTFELFQYLLKELARDRSLFLIAPNGTYLRVWLEQRADPPEGMDLEGATLHQIVGEEAAEEILRQSRISAAIGCETSAFYSAHINQQERRYVGKIQALGGGQFLMSVVRLP